MDATQMNSQMRTLSSGQFQRQCFEEILDFFKQIRIKESLKSTFTKRESTELITYYTIHELYNKCQNELSQLIQDYPHLSESIEKTMDKILKTLVMNTGNALQLLDQYGSFAEIKADYLEEQADESHGSARLTASVCNIYIDSGVMKFPQDPQLQGSLARNISNKSYLADVMRICKDVRERSRDFTSNEMGCLWSAYTILKAGTTLDYSYIGLGTSGFRGKHHTLIFSTDPGDDHIRITARSKELMDGIAVHVEHIDRDEVSSKELVEAYRLPAAINAAKVRLHISDSAPVTAFIGRPVFENANPDKNKPIKHSDFKMDKLKTVHMSASACSVMFQNGVADCKIAIERMYLSDAVEFMKSVVGNVFRTSTAQTFAAAFNLNTPYYDDKYQEQQESSDCVVLDVPFEIAKTAIRVAVDGGFDRVTWDGASNIIPSKPIIDQLSHEEFTELVHTAHENGLQTYFSAGLEAQHVEACIYTGVDGLGIGTSLHYIDPETKLMGAFNPDAIRAVLNARNKAEKTVRGQGAVLLARLDRLFYERVLTQTEEEKRQALYQAVRDKDESYISKLLKDPALARVRNMEADSEKAVIERGRRILQYARLTDGTPGENMQELKAAVENQDTAMLSWLFEAREQKADEEQEVTE